ncbi:hypothetical protein [Silanimonas sp.]|jgi:hypothetical protein|uniref:hypothetical protein n=1 Tax=Silanimonas sp. TaxID=1929290 RepID=UPI0022C3E3F6|nr:hypothetical protein [Silanimonas sp.]MCZ8064234.1 hypothetical protein [Silanimonas sp.]
MDNWSRWLFQEHPEHRLRQWARRLKLFRFVRAAGGHANDGDELVLSYRYGSVDELQSRLALLGVLLKTYELAPPQPEVGKPYSSAEFASFPSLIFGTLVEQPKWQRINGENIYIWCHEGVVKFSISDRYEVNEGSVLAAERVEQALPALALECIDPPVDRPHCICPKFYPQYFS